MAATLASVRAAYQMRRHVGVYGVEVALTLSELRTAEYRAKAGNTDDASWKGIVEARVLASLERAVGGSAPRLELFRVALAEDGHFFVPQGNLTSSVMSTSAADGTWSIGGDGVNLRPAGARARLVLSPTTVENRRQFHLPISVDLDERTLTFDVVLK